MGRSRWMAGGLAVGLVAGLLAAGLLAVSGPATAAEIRPTPANGVWTVDGHGNGHGHGLSQYGARGAAIAGLDYTRILAFYYPGTTLSTASAEPITVSLSDAGSTLTVLAEAGLQVTGVTGALPETGVDQWRLAPIAGGFQLQRHLATGWNAVKNLPASNLAFRAPDGTVAVVGGSGVRSYRGAVSAVQTGSGAVVVNTVSLDDYVRGVVPSEMPASWQPAAVQAQAVAARSYARYFIDHPRSSAYDICDTTSCQVYGGLSAEQAGSNDAVARTSNRVLTYQGTPVFAEFSASNGGMTSRGNQPYFVTKPDPYDNAASGDPYLNWTVTVSAADVAAYYGLRSVSQLQVTTRAGGAEWGGLVETGLVQGVDSSGSVTSFSVGGSDLASAMGLSYRYFHIRPVPASGALDTVSLDTLRTVAVSGWAVDRSNSATATTVRLVVDGSVRTITANLSRPDVQRALHTASPNHGYRAALTLPAGRHQVCAYALLLGGSNPTLLRCVTVTVPVSPIGHVDAITHDAKAHYRLTGWELDPDVNGGPGRVAVYVDDQGLSADAPGTRADVQRRYGLSNASVGFDVSVFVPAGTHQLCAYGINRPGTAGSNQVLLCTTVTR